VSVKNRGGRPEIAEELGTQLRRRIELLSLLVSDIFQRR